MAPRTHPGTSGKRVLLIGAIAGIAFIAAMYAGVRYDQATTGRPDSPPPPPDPAGR